MKRTKESTQDKRQKIQISGRNNDKQNERQTYKTDNKKEGTQIGNEGKAGKNGERDATQTSAGIKNVERKLKYLSKGVRSSKGRVDIRATSARWAWVEYVLAQGGPAMGSAICEALEQGGRFADWKRALNNIQAEEYSPWKHVIH